MERDLNNIKESIGESYVVNRPRGDIEVLRTFRQECADGPE